MSRIWMLGDNVNTDVIIPGRYNVTTDRAQLARYCLCEVLPAFSQQVEAGDVVMAGHNFGCGSSREHAPAALLACGVQVVRDRRFEMSRPRKQQRSHQTTSTHKKASARSRAIRLEIASEQLIEKGNIQEAVRVLREQVQTAPSDEKRRLLGECLFDLTVSLLPTTLKPSNFEPGSMPTARGWLLGSCS